MSTSDSVRHRIPGTASTEQEPTVVSNESWDSTTGHNTSSTTVDNTTAASSTTNPTGMSSDVGPEGLAPGASEANTGTGGEEEGNRNHFLECNICLDDATEPVVTQCGHLFCWTCIYRWLGVTGRTPTCPVCKAGVTIDRLVPLYGRGRENQPDPRQRIPEDDVPSRPAARPDAPQTNPNIPPPPFSDQAWRGHFFNPLQNAVFGGDAGLSLFPSLFGFQFTTGSWPPNSAAHQFAQGQPTGPRTMTRQQAQQAFISRLLFFIATLVLLVILFF